ncbi:hypothetical protein FRC17_008814 [Serendipita sp. 399]|nr:hypothetical protein FRC17_008814 [Serendipita sp. 399]
MNSSTNSTLSKQSNEAAQAVSRTDKLSELYELLDLPGHPDDASQTSSQIRRAALAPYPTPELDFDDEQYALSFEDSAYRHDIPSLSKHTKAVSYSQLSSRKSVNETPKERMNARRDEQSKTFTPLVRLLVMQIPEVNPQARLYEWIYSLQGQKDDPQVQKVSVSSQ